MKQRLIDANALLDTTEHLAQVCFGQGKCYCERTKFQQLIKKQPTVDAVPAVRCKECKYHEDEEIGMVYCPRQIGGWVKTDWFCADGERRSDE